MTSTTIDRLHADAGETAPTLHFLPPMQTQAGIIRALGRVRLLGSSELSASANGVDQLLASGFKVSIFEVDQALKRTSTLGVSDRMKFKAILGRAGLLKDGR